MANHKSSLKRIRQNEKIRENNRFLRTTVRTAVKNARAAIAAKDKDKALELVKEAEKKIQRATSSGLYHKNNASRKVSRLTRQAESL
ncbi:30S ribosomal protein S20 [bacterium]|nr:30S ribosomal protein S20 [bacterium]